MLLTNPADMDSASYHCAVYWMEGRLKTTEIAHRLGWEASKVRNFATRAFSPPRQRMSIEERQAILTSLIEFRHEHGWKGSTYDRNYVAKALTTLPVKQMPKAAELPEPDISTKAGRRELRRRKMEEHNKIQADKRRKEEISEHGLAPRREIPDALEWLRLKGWLADPGERSSDALRNKAAPSTARRHRAAEMFKRYNDGARLSALGATDYESMIMGGGGSKPLTLSEYRLFCINTVGHIAKWLSIGEFKAIEAVICNDEFVWEGAKASMKPIIFTRIHRGLDAVAVHEGLMTRKEFREQWADELPFDDPPTRNEARVQADSVAETVRSARHG